MFFPPFLEKVGLYLINIIIKGKLSKLIILKLDFLLTVLEEWCFIPIKKFYLV